MKTLCLIQGTYFFVTGVWPLLHMRSFLAVTGPKHDLWLVRTVAVLVAVIGVTLGWAGLTGDIPPGPPIVCLAIGSALGLAAIDVIHVTARIISRIYLADAAIELLLVAAWAIAAVS